MALNQWIKVNEDLVVGRDLCLPPLLEKDAKLMHLINNTPSWEDLKESLLKMAEGTASNVTKGLGEFVGVLGNHQGVWAAYNGGVGSAQVLWKNLILLALEGDWDFRLGGMESSEEGLKAREKDLEKVRVAVELAVVKDMLMSMQPTLFSVH